MSIDRKEQKTDSTLPVLLAGITLILLGGVVHGRLTQRWGPGDELARAAEAVKSFPEELGPWRLESAEPLTDRVATTLQCAGHTTRSYVNTQTSERVQMFVIVGPPGPTAVHTPEICYSSRDYTVAAPREKISLSGGGESDTFWSLKLTPKLAGEADRYVYYAWTDEEIWQASGSPRYEYAGSSHLYKIQVTGSPLLSTDDDSDLCKRFLADLKQSGWRPLAIN